MMGVDLARRLGVAAIGIPIVLVVAWWGGAAMAAGLGLLAAIGVWELGRMLRTGANRFLGPLSAAGAAAIPYVAWAVGAEGVVVLLTLLLLVMLAAATLRIRPLEGPFRAVALSFAAAAYVGGMLSYGLLLRETPGADPRLGTALFFLPVGVTWLADTAAYFGGRLFGRRPMAPVVSPNKTMEGGIAALLAGPVGALAIARLAIPEVAALGVLPVAVLGLLIAGAAILGDLVESAIKRECGVKDSSNLLPGHGGLLDRMDSLLWAIPVAHIGLSVLL